jgi:hypothetical protein
MIVFLASVALAALIILGSISLTLTKIEGHLRRVSVREVPQEGRASE